MSDPDQNQLRQKIDTFMDQLKHGKLSEQGSYAIASSTLSVLRLLVEDSSWNSAQDLMTSVRKEGRALISRCGQTSVSSIVGNMVRRVLKLIREESSNSEDHSDQVDSFLLIFRRHCFSRVVGSHVILADFQNKKNKKTKKK